MNKWILIGGFVLACLMVCPVQAGSVDLDPGLWEITSQTNMSGRSMPASTITQCITNDSVVPQPQSGQGGGQCEVSDVEINGNTVSWSITCSTQGGAMNGTGEITYHGDTFEGISHMTMQGMEIQTEMSGKRIGECQ